MKRHPEADQTLSFADGTSWEPADLLSITGLWAEASAVVDEEAMEANEEAVYTALAHAMDGKLEAIHEDYVEGVPAVTYVLDADEAYERGLAIPDGTVIVALRRASVKVN